MVVKNLPFGVGFELDNTATPQTVTPGQDNSYELDCPGQTLFVSWGIENPRPDKVFVTKAYIDDTTYFTNKFYADFTCAEGFTEPVVIMWHFTYVKVAA
jgi:hypothetical protein